MLREDQMVISTDDGEEVIVNILFTHESKGKNYVVFEFTDTKEISGAIFVPHDNEDSGVFEDIKTEEEWKMVKETQKILDHPDIRVSATTVRVPVKGGHSLSVNASFKKSFNMEEVYALLKSFPGLKIRENGTDPGFVTPMEAEGRDPVFVSRIRRDLSLDNTLDMWIVADNLRKGAALNAVQIAEKLLSF